MGLRNVFGTVVTDLEGFNKIYVDSLAAFILTSPPIVSNVITLRDNSSYIFSKPIDFGDLTFFIPDNGRVKFSAMNDIAQSITCGAIGGIPFIRGNVDRLDLTEIRINCSSGLANLLSIGKAPVPISNFPLVSIDRCIINDFNSLGSVNDIVITITDNAFIGNGEGFTFNNLIAAQTVRQTFAGHTGDSFIITGSLDDGFFDNTVDFHLTNTATFNIASTVTGNRIIIKNSLIGGSPLGTLFKAGGKDQTDPLVVSLNNTAGVPDSNWIGSMGFSDNVTPTVISSIDTYTDISGTMAGNINDERFTISGNILTYIGKEDIKALALTDISATRTIPASSNRTIKTAVFVDSGSGFVEKGSAPMDMSGILRAYSFHTLLLLQTGDKIKGMIKNVDTTDDILPVNFRLTVSKL